MSDARRRDDAPLPLRLLARRLPRGRAEELLGDLHEDHRRRRRRHGALRESIWAWRQALAWWLTTLGPEPGRLTELGRGWAADLRFALSLMVKRPGLSAVVVLTLGLCLGAGAAVFSVVQAAIFDPWPYEAPFRIVVLRGETPVLDRPLTSWSVPEAVELTSRPVFEAAVMGHRWDVTLTAGSGPPERFRGAVVNAGVWSMLGVEPTVGRTFTAAEDRPGGDRVVVIGHALWQGRFGGDPDILGRELSVEGEPYTVIGVMPPRFRYWGAQLWAPLQLDTGVADRADRFLTVQGRLREGLSLEGAEADLRALAERLEREHGGAVPAYRDLRFDLGLLHDEVLGDVRQALLVLSGSVLLVLLVACFNIANLLLARTVARRRELGVRAALGASRVRILRQLLIEALVLSLLAGILGIGLAKLGLAPLLDLLPRDPVPAEAVVEIEGWTLATTLALSLLAGLVLAAPAAWSALRLAPGEALAARRRGSSDSSGLRRTRAGLLVSQVGVSMLVVCAAVWLATSYSRLSAVDPGFAGEDRVTMRVELSRDAYAEAGEIVGFYRELIRGLAARPGVRGAAVVQFPALAGAPPVRFAPVGADGPGATVTPAAADLNYVGPGYFDALEIPLSAGRGFREADDATAPAVAVVSAALAERHWPDRDAVGGRLRLEVPVRAASGGMEDAEPVAGLAAASEVTVVGVVGDVRQEGLDEPIRPQIYLPHAQSLSPRTGLPMRFMSLTVHSELPLQEVAETARRELRRIDPEIPLLQVRTYEDVAVDSVGSARFTSVLLLLFAVLAALLATVGIFALTAHGVSTRIREIGIRRALGASDTGLRWMLVRRGLLIAGAGIVAGGVVAALSQRLVAGLVHGLDGTALPTILAAAAGFGIVALIAAYLPARRIARVDPGSALRTE